MQIPKEVINVLNQLRKKGIEAFLVGGCVRDLLRETEPQDWDIATNASPENIIGLFPKTFSDNAFGTVTVLTGSDDPKLKEIQITPYRIDEKYTDKRHPDSVKFAKTIEEDLARRDFTVNAMALSCEECNIKQEIIRGETKIIDPFKGQEDLKKKIIKTVGKAEDRFSEDALRLMRAVRLSIVLGKDWKIEPKTAQAIKKNAPWLQAISKERIKEELMKIIMDKRAADGIELLRELSLLKYIIPELEEGYGVGQNKHHAYGVYEHLIMSLKYAAEQGFNKYVRIASLLHDVAKPRVKQGEGLDSTFYNHEIVGARMTIQILNRLKFSRKDIEKITKLVRFHLFYYNVGEVSEASVRRLVRRAGPENMDELLQVRMADRIGSGVPKAEPYKLRHLKYIIEKVSQDPISVKRLKISGGDVMKILNIKPGPKVGCILDILLGEVIDNPKANTKKYLEKSVRKIGEMAEKEIIKTAKKAIKEREKLEIKKDAMTKKKYWVS